MLLDCRGKLLCKLHRRYRDNTHKLDCHTNLCFCGDPDSTEYRVTGLITRPWLLCQSKKSAGQLSRFEWSRSKGRVRCQFTRFLSRGVRVSNFIDKFSSHYLLMAKGPVDDNGNVFIVSLKSKYTHSHTLTEIEPLDQ